MDVFMMVLKDTEYNPISATQSATCCMPTDVNHYASKEKVNPFNYSFVVLTGLQKCFSTRLDCQHLIAT